MCYIDGQPPVRATLPHTTGQSLDRLWTECRQYRVARPGRQSPVNPWTACKQQPHGYDNTAHQCIRNGAHQPQKCDIAKYIVRPAAGTRRQCPHAHNVHVCGCVVCTGTAGQRLDNFWTDCGHKRPSKTTHGHKPCTRQTTAGQSRRMC